METRTYTVYKFNELSEEVQEKAIKKLYDINVDYEWYSDDEWYDLLADDYGIKVDMKEVNFDIDRTSYVAFDTFNHSRKPTWKRPIEIINLQKFIEKAGLTYNSESYVSINHVHYAGGIIKNTIITDDYDVDVLQECLDEMLVSMLRQLRKTYKYLTSREAIIETIQANEYYFTANGTID